MISVVIPVYKVEKYIGGCINSVINQSINDFELILVDDGTPDQSIEIAEKMLTESWIENYRIIHTENRGVSAARNTGLLSATGEFVIMVDADDVLSQCFLEDMLRITRDYPENDIYSSGFSVVHENKAEYFDKSEEKNIANVYTSEDAIMVFRSRKVKFLLPTLMLRRRFLDTYQIVFDEKVRYSEDVQFIWRCLFYNKRPVIHLNKANYNYILHGNSTMTASGIDKILTGFRGLKGLSDEAKEVVDNQLLDTIVCQMYFSLLHSSAKMLAYKDFHILYGRAECKQKLKKMKECDCRYRIVTAILKKNLRSGYYIMHFL